MIKDSKLRASEHRVRLLDKSKKYDAFEKNKTKTYSATHKPYECFKKGGGK